MKTYNEAGDVLTLTAPSGGVVSGTAYLIGSLVVIALETKAQTLAFDALVVGCADVVKVEGEAWTEGLKVYWDDSAKKFTNVVGSNTLCGVAIPPIVPVVVTLATSALAADLLISGMTLQVLDYAQLETDNATVTVTINGVAYVLTEDVEWNAITSNNQTATNLAAAITALTGVSAVAATDTVTVTKGTGISIAATTTGRVRLDGAAR
jgi:predicted RecA/RadA family phage recombinase